MFAIFGVFFIAVGLLHILKPHWIYQKTQAWKNQNGGEPSSAFLLQTRVMGVIITVSGLVLLIGPLVWGNT